jgi:glycine/D-amino acid oxidase-like deaminating enzyme
VRFDGQARFHPLKYLGALASTIPGGGSFVFERTTVDTVTDDPLAVTAGPWRVSTGFVVVATHLPIAGRTGLLRAAMLQADLYPYSTYAIGAHVEPGQWPDALVWDLADPYHYVRVDHAVDHDYVIFGGGDHKTGQVDDTRRPFEDLERLLRSLLPGAVVTHRWSGQVIETRDGLPYIGETAPRQFVVTGFSGNGMTYGTLGAMMARDAAVGHGNRWAALFDSGRSRLAEGLWRYVRENKEGPGTVRHRWALRAIFTQLRTRTGVSSFLEPQDLGPQDR